MKYTKKAFLRMTPPPSPTMRGGQAGVDMTRLLKTMAIRQEEEKTPYTNQLVLLKDELQQIMMNPTMDPGTKLKLLNDRTRVYRDMLQRSRENLAMSKSIPATTTTAAAVVTPRAKRTPPSRPPPPVKTTLPSTPFLSTPRGRPPPTSEEERQEYFKQLLNAKKQLAAELLEEKRKDEERRKTVKDSGLGTSPPASRTRSKKRKKKKEEETQEGSGKKRRKKRGGSIAKSLPIGSLWKQIDKELKKKQKGGSTWKIPSPQGGPFEPFWKNVRFTRL